ncbi:hypothetical protein [Streptomyces sp. NRRL S-118]|uniref:hypothetical protein n=1 Tax=Streptomyces sp. NRRL S-118 TaxID=1463881 RepID=UPI0004C67687|nr:hypothetical protein [Streptomyces sp. NRRL S-118]
MRLTLTRFRPRTGPHEHRIVVPRPALRHTTLSDPLEGWGYLVGDHDGLSRLAALFAFAAFSRHTVVHVPLRRSIPRQYAPGVPVDLVLAHHSLGLRPSAWPELRRRSTHGTPLTVRTDERRTAAHAAAWWERSEHRDGPDRLRPAVHAQTLFLFGSRDVFAAACGKLEHAAGFGPHHERAAEGVDALVASLTPLLAPDGSRRRTELDIAFRARPPHRHFRPPGRPPASRRPPPAASP